MTRYAVVITDRTVDGKGNPVKSPFDQVYHAAHGEHRGPRAAGDQPAEPRRLLGGHRGHRARSRRVHLELHHPAHRRRPRSCLRDGLYGAGPLRALGHASTRRRSSSNRAIGLVSGILDGPEQRPARTGRRARQAMTADCGPKLGNLYVIKYDDHRSAQMKELLEQGFGFRRGAGHGALLTAFENIDHMVIGTYKSPFLIEGGPQGIDPDASFDLELHHGAGRRGRRHRAVLARGAQGDGRSSKQPFDVDIYGHGYTGNFSELLLYAGNMAQHGLATIGINAVGHGLVLGDQTATNFAGALLAGLVRRALLRRHDPEPRARSEQRRHPRLGRRLLVELPLPHPRQRPPVGARHHAARAHPPLLRDAARARCSAATRRPAGPRPRPSPAT